MLWLTFGCCPFESEKIKAVEAHNCSLPVGLLAVDVSN
jgi:hypothetical protein